MPVKFPEYVSVGIHKYGISYPHPFREATRIFGQCDNCLHEIRISEMDQGGSRRPDTAILATFFHELLHAVDSIYMDGRVAGLSDSEKELIISQFAEGLTQAFVNGHFPVVE